MKTSNIQLNSHLQIKKREREYPFTRTRYFEIKQEKKRKYAN